MPTFFTAWMAVALTFAMPAVIVIAALVLSKTTSHRH